MASMKEMIARFRSAAPTSKEVRSQQLNNGQLQQMWWVKDNDANHGNTSFTRDTPYYAFNANSNGKENDEDQNFGFKASKSAYNSKDEVNHGSSYGRHNRAKSVSVLDDDDDDDLEKDDLFASKMAAYERGLEEKTRGRNKYTESPLASTNKDGPRYRFIKSPTKSKNAVHDNYDFVATDHASLQRMNGDRRDPLAEHNAPSVDTLLRQAALRSALKIQEKPQSQPYMGGMYGVGGGFGSVGPSMGPSMGPSSYDYGGGGGGSSGVGIGGGRDGYDSLWGDGDADYSPPRRSKKGKGDASINKKATAIEIGQDLDSTLARLVESFHIGKDDIPPVEEDIKKTLKNEFGNEDDNGEEEEKVLPSSIAQIADDLMISLMPFEMLYKHREEKENEENEKFESERKNAEQAAEERAKDKLLDMIANHWGQSEFEGEDANYTNPFSFLQNPQFLEDNHLIKGKEEDKVGYEKQSQQQVEDGSGMLNEIKNNITIEDKTAPVSQNNESDNENKEEEKYCDEEVKENDEIDPENKKSFDSKANETPVGGIASISDGIVDQMKSLTSLATNRMKEIENLSKGNLLPSPKMSDYVDKGGRKYLYSPRSNNSVPFTSSNKEGDESTFETEVKDVASSTWQAILSTANSKLEKMAKEKLDEDAKKIDNLAVMRSQQRKAKALARKEIDEEYRKILEASNTIDSNSTSSMYPYTSSSGVKEASGEICSDLEIHMLCMQKRLGHIEKGQQDKKTTEDKNLDKDSNELNSLFSFKPDYLRSITDEEKKEKEEFDKEMKRLADIQALKARAELDAWLDDQGESFILEKAELLRKEKELAHLGGENDGIEKESDIQKLSKSSVEFNQKKNLEDFSEITGISRHPIFSTKKTGDLYFDEITATFSPRIKPKDARRDEIDDLDEIERLRKRLHNREKDRLVSSLFENQRLSRSEPYPDQHKKVRNQEAAKRDKYLSSRTEELSKSRDSLHALKTLREKIALTAFDI